MHPLRVLLTCLCLLSVASGAGATRDENAEAPRFDILEFRIDGNSVLDELVIERAVYGQMGPGRNFDHVEAARAALERAYHDAGYLTVFVDIPEQEVKDGVVTLRVTEAPVDRLRVRGTKYTSPERVRQVAAALAEGTVPYFPKVQKALQSLSRSPDRKVTPVLRSSTTPGRVDAELAVEDRSAFHGSVELTNRYTANTEPLRLSAALRYDNLWQREHSASLLLLTAPEDPSQVRVFVANYVFRPGDGDDVLAFYVADSKSDVAAASNLNLLGRGRIYGTRYVMPLRSREAGYSHSFTLGADYKDLTDIQTGGSALTTPISYVPLSAQYSATQRGQKGVTQGSATVTAGMRDVLGNHDDEFARKRAGAHANYVAIRGELSREQRLPKGMTLYARVGGQAASQPLVSTEQYAAGGVDTVRGYLEAEALGDHAITGRLELRSPVLRPAALGGTEFSALGFFDIADLHVSEVLPTQTGHFLLASTGLGLRARSAKGLSASLDVGRALQSARYTTSGDTRAQFRVAYDF